MSTQDTHFSVANYEERIESLKEEKHSIDLKILNEIENIKSKSENMFRTIIVDFEDHFKSNLQFPLEDGFEHLERGNANLKSEFNQGNDVQRILQDFLCQAYKLVQEK